MLFLVVVTGSMPYTTAIAENMRFLPGDVFFHGTLSRKMIQDARDSGVITIDYTSPTPGSFSGHAGYSRLKLVCENEKYLDSIDAAYTRIRLNSPRLQRVVKKAIYGDRVITIRREEIVEEESNPLSIFVYNKATDIMTTRIGIKYNETWKQEFRRFSDRAKGPPALDEFVKSHQAISESWSRAEEVPALSALLPMADPLKGKSIDEPITCQAANCMAVVTSDVNYDDIYNRTNGVIIFTISVDGVEEYVGTKGQWERQEKFDIVQESE
ncbi:MAG: hypothetical protein DWH91_15100 [Planctomycetota bacterium]|nr:MAG: hypothetical protein DWH91_15100 [Planctomycetota bacterium]